MNLKQWLNALGLITNVDDEQVSETLAIQSRSPVRQKHSWKPVTL